MSDLENLRVVKVGGSLLSSNRLGPRIKEWVERQPPVPTVWLVGGGKLVDVVRDWQSCNSQAPAATDEDAHWMSVDLLSVTAKMFKTFVGSWPIESSLDSLSSRLDLGEPNVIFDCRTWLRTVKDLPCSWSVTSDSIAGRLAFELSSKELILLKSRAASGETVRENVAQGVIDKHFATLELECKVTFVNFNSKDLENCYVFI
jgi:aspartokinase-like uncharacterized kinase